MKKENSKNLLKKMNIKQRLILELVVLSLVTAIIGTLSVSLLKRQNDDYFLTLQYEGFSQGDIGNAMHSLALADEYIHDYISFYNEEKVKNAYDNISVEEESLANYLTKIESAVHTDKEKELLNTAKNALQEYKKIANEIIAAKTSSDPALINDLQLQTFDRLDPQYDLISNSLTELMNIKVTYGTASGNQLNKETNTFTIILIIITIIFVAMAMLFGFIFSKDVCKPIAECAERLVKLSEGDLTSPVPQTDYHDETEILINATNDIVTRLNNIITDEQYLLGEMANGNLDVSSEATNIYVGDFEPLLISMNNIISGLTKVLTEINLSSEQVASGSDQVACGAQALSQGATEQASSIEELSATITEISEHINATARNTIEASNKANDASAGVTESNSHMHDMIDAMNQITNTSNEIGKIIKTIDDIAFQTNILALNAAVEAARAGTAGKGFAVVADEVRNLAQKSAEAAQTTTALIESAISAIGTGTQIADKTAISLKNVVDQVTVVSNKINEIAEASEEQATAISQLTTGIEQISAVVQTNSATSEESASASEELSSQAQMLKSIIGNFKLKESSESIITNSNIEDNSYKFNFDDISSSSKY